MVAEENASAARNADLLCSCDEASSPNLAEGVDGIVGSGVYCLIDSNICSISHGAGVSRRHSMERIATARKASTPFPAGRYPVISFLCCQLRAAKSVWRSPDA